MVENGDQHHNASFIKSVQDLKQPNKTKQKTQKYSSTSCVVKETSHGFHNFNLINQDYMKHEVLRV